MRVPTQRYTSPSWLARELERVFRRVWLLVAHGSEVAAPGDFLLLEVAGESVLLVRDEAGRARAHFNVCQHRGATLCATSPGHARSFRCPYHHWEYGLDGALVSAPGAGTAADGARLRSLHCEERHGFVWVCFADEPPSLDAWLAPVAAELERYRPAEYRLVREHCVEVRANWKASVDVNNEAYHLPTLHPELLGAFDVRTVQEELRGPHSATRLVLGQPSTDVAQVPPALAGLFQMMTGQPLPAGTRPGAVRGALAEGLRARAKAEGVELSGFTDELLTSKQQVQLFPNVQLNFTALGLELYRHRPHPTDPARCWFDEVTYVRAGRTPPPPPTRRRFAHGEVGLGPVMGADVDLLPRLQAGMSSRALPELRLTEREPCLANFHRVLSEYVGEPT